MVWVTLVRLGIKPEKGLEIDELDSASKVCALPSPKRLRAGRSKAFTTCLPVSGSIQGTERVWPG